jgi:hypothetical protein
VDGLTPARAVTTIGARTAARAGITRAGEAYAIGIAGPDDDPEIRRLLRTSAFAGQVSLSLEREPDSALAASIEGDEHETIVARDAATGILAGTAGRSVREVYLNGALSRIDYLGQLRIDPRFRHRRGLLRAGFDFCRRQSGSPISLASVVADNMPARRLLSRHAAGWPRFEPVDTLVSLAIPVARRSEAATGGTRGFELLPGSRAHLNGIVACIERHARGFQFSPRWKRTDFDSPRTRGLKPEDFTLALRDGQVVACLACWDQRAFKQAVVRGYSKRFARWRRLLNACAPLTGLPRLPAVGDALQFGYLSHAGFDHEDERTAIALIAGACRHARSQSLEYVVLGLSGRSRMLHAVKRAFPHRAYESVLYVAFWPEGEPLAASLDRRPSNPELAIL